MFDEIDAIFEDDITSNTPPKWAKELLNEIKEVKEMLNKTYTVTKTIQTDLNDFIDEFKYYLKSKISNNIYPVARYKGQEVSINQNNKLFDIHTNVELTTIEAFNAYRTFHKKGYKLNYKKVG